MHVWIGLFKFIYCHKHFLEYLGELMTCLLVVISLFNNHFKIAFEISLVLFLPQL
jgi:hypothetical protein